LFGHRQFAVIIVLVPVTIARLSLLQLGRFSSFYTTYVVGPETVKPPKERILKGLQPSKPPAEDVNASALSFPA
jgi:hypothetical protein